MTVFGHSVSFDLQTEKTKTLRRRRLRCSGTFYRYRFEKILALELGQITIIILVRENTFAPRLDFVSLGRYDRPSVLATYRVFVMPRDDRRRKPDLKPASQLLRPDPGPGICPTFDSPNSRQWEIVIRGALEDDEDGLHEKLVELPRGSRGLIYFDSCGGSAFVGLALASLIRLRGLKATGVVVGECSSAALMPFAACAQRFVTPHSTLLFHPIRWHMRG